MTIERVEFASLLASRLCHDLLSPIGAFANGLELLADERDPAMRARCFELLEQSARTSTNKLKFFRLAFGSAGGFGDLIDPEEARQALTGIIPDGRDITIDWMVPAGPLPKPAVKTILNLGMILVDGLVRGGRVVVGCEPTGRGVEIALRAEGERMILDDQVEAALKVGGVPMTSRTAPAFLVRMIAEALGGSVTLARESGQAVMVGALLPNA